VLAICHVFYNWIVAYRLLDLSEGIHKIPNGWTEYGRSDFAWTTPLYLPGSLVLRLALHPQEHYSISPLPYGFMGILMLLTASVASGWALASAILNIKRDKAFFGLSWYRVIFVLAGWVWIYVPVEWSWVYHWTIIY